MMQANEAGLYALKGMHQTSPKILIVDQDEARRKALRVSLASENRQFLEASSTNEALQLMARVAIDLVLVDYQAPDLGAPAFCNILKNDRLFRLIPVFVLAASGDASGELASYTVGADAFLLRPFRSALLRVRIQAALQQKAVLDSLDDIEAAIFSLAQLVEARDCATGTHCLRMALLASKLGAAFRLSASDILTLQRGAYLHDIGKVAVPDAILFKRGPLTPEEWSLMQKHPVLGEHICEPLRSLSSVLPIIRHHHERWDGSGYPDRLEGDKTPLLARILQIVDIYDALTTERPYKRAFSFETALHMIQEEAAKGWRDPEIIREFVKLAPEICVIENDEDMRASLCSLAGSLDVGNLTRKPANMFGALARNPLPLLAG